MYVCTGKQLQFKYNRAHQVIKYAVKHLNKSNGTVRLQVEENTVKCSRQKQLKANDQRPKYIDETCSKIMK